MQSIRIATYNIRLSAGNDGPNAWPLRKDALAEYLRGLQLDVLGVQEALPDQVEFLERELPNFRRFGVGREDGDTQGEHCAIYVREDWVVARHGTFWFSDTPRVPNSRTWGNQITRITTWIELHAAARPWLITNSHLDHQSDPSRRESVRALCRFLERCPLDFLALGDFNMPPANPNLAPLFRMGKSAMAEAGDANRPTFHGWQFGEGSDAIDFIIAGPHFELRSAGSPRVPHSDHYPVIAEYNWMG
ncbi:MAG: endonuclease/exonuclease/phosphatase family protein [Fimbriimonadaceae bacterium]|nr:endonuclease/exonuclease/phosphatase family protein [Fimbriimonadaceae bacterium]